MKIRFVLIALMFIALLMFGLLAVGQQAVEFEKRQVSPVNFPEIEIEEEKPTFPVDLADDLQHYTYSLCEENNVPFELAVAVMSVESDFRTDIVSEGGDYGLMQINKVNHEWLSDKLGVTDFLEPKQNIQCGVYMLSALIEKYEEPHKVLMAYNIGEYGAKKYWKQGITSTNYSRKVIERMENYI